MPHDVLTTTLCSRPRHIQPRGLPACGKPPCFNECYFKRAWRYVKWVTSREFFFAALVNRVALGFWLLRGDQDEKGVGTVGTADAIAESGQVACNCHGLAKRIVGTNIKALTWEAMR
jgi:hypothetical protein